MTLRALVRSHRPEIDAHILRVCPNIRHLNDDERRLWVLNDEPLYNWARSLGWRG